MTTIQRTALSLLIATAAFAAAGGSPALAQARAHASAHALAARAQAFPGNALRLAPARADRNAVNGLSGRYIGSDPSGYVRIEMTKDCHACS